jgi:hypothetical protein
MSSEYAPGGGPGNNYGNTYGGGYGDPTSRPKNGMGVAGLVLGILALLSSWFVLGLPLAIVGLILSIVGLRRVRSGRATNRGVALGGVIVNAVALLLSVVLTAVYAFTFWALWNNGGQEAVDCIQNAQDQVQVQQCIDQYSMEQPDS